MTSARFALATIIVVGASCALGCTKTCDVSETDASVRSDLRYTEPVLTHEARVERLQQETDANAALVRERTRGRARVVDERRKFEDSISVYPKDGTPTVILTSVVSTPLVVEGFSSPVTISMISVLFDKPSAVGAHSLEDLHARVCESFAGPPSRSDAGADGYPSGGQWTEVCAAAAGTLRFASSGENAFEAALEFSDANGDSASASIRGTAQLHYAAIVRTEPCPDIGRIPIAPP